MNLTRGLKHGRQLYALSKGFSNQEFNRSLKPQILIGEQEKTISRPLIF